MRLKLTLAALAASMTFASTAYAQVVPPASDTGQARGTVLRPLSVNNDEPLDFGTVLVDGSNAGWVEVSAENGTRSVDGLGGVQLVALNPGGRGLFTVTSTIGRSVTLTLTPPVGNVVVEPGGDQINVSDIHLDNTGVNVWTDTRVTGASGFLVVGVGGRFQIRADQQNGLYTADYQLTAEYN